MSSSDLRSKGCDFQPSDPISEPFWFFNMFGSKICHQIFQPLPLSFGYEVVKRQPLSTRSTAAAAAHPTPLGATASVRASLDEMCPSKCLKILQIEETNSMENKSKLYKARNIQCKEFLKKCNKTSAEIV